MEKAGGSSWQKPTPLKEETPRSRPQSARVARPGAGCRSARRAACGGEPSAAKRSDANPCTLHHRPYPFFLSYLHLHLVFHCTLSFRASSKVLRALLLVGAGLISWVPHFTTSIGWALRLGLHCLQQAQRPLDEPWVCVADFTVQLGCKKALIVLRVPVSAFSMGRALTLKQVEVIGLRLGETWNGARVNTVLRALFERCGWPSHVVSDCGSDIKKGIVETILEAPKRASWISDVRHVVANALKHYYAKLSLFQQFQRLCTRMRYRLQQTRLAHIGFQGRGF